MKKYLLLFCLLLGTGCVVIPETDKTYVAKCEISTDQKTLRIIDSEKETKSYYSIGGVFLVPISGIVLGAYVVMKNSYYYGKEKIICN